MLSTVLVFEVWPDPHHRAVPLSSKVSFLPRGWQKPSPNLLHRRSERLREWTSGAMSRLNVWHWDKATYCTSVRLREQNFCCQLNLRKMRLKSHLTKLCMLTYHLGLLSNPCQPQFRFCKGNTFILYTVTPHSILTLSVVYFALTSTESFRQTTDASCIKKLIDFTANQPRI